MTERRFHHAVKELGPQIMGDLELAKKALEHQKNFFPAEKIAKDLGNVMEVLRSVIDHLPPRRSRVLPLRDEERVANVLLPIYEAAEFMSRFGDTSLCKMLPPAESGASAESVLSSRTARNLSDNLFQQAKKLQLYTRGGWRVEAVTGHAFPSPR